MIRRGVTKSKTQGFVRKRVLPVIFPAGEGTSASPIGHVPHVAADVEKSPGLLLREWETAEAGGAMERPEAGSKVVDRAAGNAKLGAIVAVSPGESQQNMSTPITNGNLLLTLATFRRFV